MKKRVNFICITILMVVSAYLGLMLYCAGVSFCMGFKTALENEKNGQEMGARAAYLSLIPNEVTDLTSVSISDAVTGEKKEAWALSVLVPAEESSTSSSPAMTLALSLLNMVGSVVALIGIVQFVICLNRNEVFSWKTVKSLRKSGFGLLLAGAATSLMGFFQVLAALDYIQPSNYTVNYADQIELGMIIFGLFLLLMSEAFALGLRLQEEQELTI